MIDAGFTDEEVKRLRVKAERSNTYTNMDCDRVIALLARLDAAEQALDVAWHRGKDFMQRLKVWHKSAGRTEGQ